MSLSFHFLIYEMVAWEHVFVKTGAEPVRAAHKYLPNLRSPVACSSPALLRHLSPTRVLIEVLKEF